MTDTQAPATTPVTLTVNGKEQTATTEDRTLLVNFLRNELGLTGTHVGCQTGQCGACTVVLDGEAVKSCMVLATQAAGHEVMTVEGLGKGSELHPIQEAFWEEHGLQCGYCTPGMLLSTYTLLQDTPDPDDAAIRHGIEGNICRCTGYHNIVKSVREAARRTSGTGTSTPEVAE
ncbi:MAG TPA: (2Fe-2S)-binding protein [Thermomicrobiales bacterium]|nr:(2Fe-2S)-binding protein [Thermomicrobiales bacterium]